MKLQATYCQARRAHLIEQVTADVIIISNPRHVLYFSGYWPTPLHIGTWGTPHLIIQSDTGETTLLTHNFAPDTATAFVDHVDAWHWYDAATYAASALFPSMVNALNRHIPDGGKRIAVERGWFPSMSINENLDFIDITASILAMRREKDPDEIDVIMHCMHVVEAGHYAARAAIRPGVSEIDVYNAVYSAMVTSAGEPVVPLGDFVSGERTSQVGGPPTHRVLQEDDLMIIDLFPVIGGYRADLTVTYSVSSKLSEAQRKLQSALHAAIRAGERLLKPGAHASGIYHAIRQELHTYGLAGVLPHHAGHGIGLGHPEAPYLVPDSDEVLQIGDVITLEPGAYGANFGGRIEHNYHITPDGFQRLSNHNTNMTSSP